MARKKRKTKQKKKNTHYLLYIIYSLIALIVMGGVFIAGYYTGNTHAQHKQEDALAKQHLQHKQSRLKEHHTNVQTTKSVQEKLKKVLKEEIKPYNTASHEIEDESLANPPRIIPPHKQIYTTKPKLAIVIDDVQTAAHIRAIKSLDLVVTMSFLPPRAGRLNSAKLAAKESFYMVHLPLEAMHFGAEEPHTLRVSDSQKQVMQRITQIKKLFPRVHYLNNHTGSKFTSNEEAMSKLIFALQKNDILFVDSRTIGKTKAPKVLEHFGMKYVSRDIFLDHHPDKAYIKEQIKKAIALAKKRGHAIAIGHPHKATLEALYESKELLKQVDLVQINQIY